MNRYARRLRRTIVAVVVFFAMGTLAITAFTLWRLRSDAVDSGLELAATHAQRVAELLTQSLQTSELIAANVVEHDIQHVDAHHLSGDFVATLRRIPFVRSMSLLDADGTVLASSNAANVGRVVALADFLPASAAEDVLRVGRPWFGRDLATGWPSAPQAQAASDAAGFIPVAQTLLFGERRRTLLVALNSDYFVNSLASQLDAQQGRVEVLRYDGTRLLASDPNRAPGALRELRNLGLPEVESGRLVARDAAGRGVLTAFRASRLYPLVAIAEIDRDYALRHWLAEAKLLLAVVGAALAATIAFAVAFYRRQVQMINQRVEFRRLQRINAMVFESSPVATLVADDAARIVSLNAEYARLTGYRAGELIGRSLYELLDERASALFEAGTRAPGAGESGAAAPGSGLVPSFEIEQRCRDGSTIWLEVISTPERNARGQVCGYHRICRNVTERKRMEERVRQLAFHDALTRLPNRRLLGDRLQQAMAASSRNGYYGALMFLDLDNFKPLNDVHGHAVGDLLLIEVARRLAHCVREADTVARFGGDEFVVMLSTLSRDRAESEAQALAVAEKVREALSMPYRLVTDAATGALVEHRCSASIGVTLFLGHESSQDEIIRRADAAMYAAKEEGRNGFRPASCKSTASDQSLA